MAWLRGRSRSDNPLRLFGLVLVSYVAGAVLTAQFFGALTVAAFFPAAGVTVSAMLLSPRSRWPVIIAAIVLGELLVDFSHGVSWEKSVGFVLADVIEPLVGASVVRAWRGGGTPDLRRTRDLCIFVAGACVLAPAVGGLVNGVFNFLQVGTPWMVLALQWFAGDGISVLVVGGSILLWPRQSYILKRRPVETVVVLLAAVVLSNIGFRTGMPPAILVMPVLAWAAVRLSMLGTALTGSVVAFTGNYANVLHQGAISEMEASDFEKLNATQVFIAVMVLTAMIIAQEVSRRRGAFEERDVEHARAEVLHSALQPNGSVGADVLDYGACLEPSDVVHHLGGDWYDVMQLPNRRTYFAVGDIVGHGLLTVEDMVQLRTAGRAFAHRSGSASELLADLNCFAVSVTRGTFATMMVAIFDHENGLLSYCSAGHPPALLRRGDGGGVVRLADANGPALGLQADVAYNEAVVRIHPGDVLVLYTDGLVERAGSTIWDGISQVERLLAESPPTTLLDCRAVVGKLAPPPRSDDTCLVAVRFAGAMLS